MSLLFEVSYQSIFANVSLGAELPEFVDTIAKRALLRSALKFGAV
jgi:hypothetical protein